MRSSLYILLVLTTVVSAYASTKVAVKRTVASEPQDEITMGGETVSTCYALVRFSGERCAVNSAFSFQLAAMNNLVQHSEQSFTSSYLPITVLKDTPKVENQLLVSSQSSQSGQKAREVLEGIPKRLRARGFISAINPCLNISVRMLGCSEPQLSNR